MNKEAQQYKKALTELTRKVVIGIEGFDTAMKQPNSRIRDKNLAAIANHFEVANDSAMHLGLGWGFRKIENLKKKLARP